MKHIKEVIVVEGRYDKNTVSQVVSGTIIETAGFGILNNKEKLGLLRMLADKRGIIVLTDSDYAGFLIRGKLMGFLGDANVKHAYIPDIKGCEKRKSSPSKEGKLGVEGMSAGIILNALRQAGATFTGESPNSNKNDITKSDMFLCGLSGKEGSLQNRRKLLTQLNLPQRLTANGLLSVLNILYTREEFYQLTGNK